MDARKIDRIQVNRVGKNATDNRLLMDIGEILADNLWGNEVGVFVLVSGDGDFASACEVIQAKGKKVIGVGNGKQTSQDLQAVCDGFYYLGDLERQLSELEKLHPIPPNEVRTFFKFLFHAYYQLTEQDDWVSYSQLGNKLREITPDYDSKFGQYRLSEWLKNFGRDFESNEQMIRRIDPNLEMTRLNLLLKAYIDTKQPDGSAHLAELGQALRKRDPNYDRRFGSKKLSEWLNDYPDTFRMHDDCVVHRQHWDK